MSIYEVRIEEALEKWFECCRKIKEIAKTSLVDCYGNNVYEGALLDKNTNSLRIYHNDATLEHIENFQEASGLGAKDIIIFFPFFAVKQDSIMKVKGGILWMK